MCYTKKDRCIFGVRGNIQRYLDWDCMYGISVSDSTESDGKAECVSNKQFQKGLKGYERTVTKCTEGHCGR